MSVLRSKRSIKTRKIYTAGNRADGKWVHCIEEASTMARSTRKEGLMQRPIELQAILQKELEEDSDATMVMKDDDDQDTYTKCDDVHKESDASGNRADGRWVDCIEEASTMAWSTQKEGLMQRPIEWQAILQ